MTEIDQCIIKTSTAIVRKHRENDLKREIDRLKKQIDDLQWELYSLSGELYGWEENEQ